MNPIRPVDRARARAAMLAAVTADIAMLDNAVQEAADDENVESIHLLVAAIAEDAASIALEAAGGDAEQVTAALRAALVASIEAAS